MRQTRLVVFALLMLLIPFRPAEGQDEPEVARVRALEKKLIDSYRQRQVEVFASLLDDDFVITFEDGTLYGKTGYLSYSATSSIRVDVAETSELKIRIRGNTAILTGKYYERGEDKGKPYEDHDRFTDVWMKKDGKWRLIASHYAIPVKN